jgi:adenylate cyclase
LKHSRFALTVGTVLGLVLWLLFALPMSPFAALELGAWDLRAAAKRDVARPDPGIVIVDMDDEALEAIGEYPWSRRIHAQLIAKLKAWGAKVIAFDVVFMSAGQVPSDDLALRQAISGAGNVVLAGLERMESTSGGERVMYSEPVFPAENGAVGVQPDPADGAIRTSMARMASGMQNFDIAVVRKFDPALADRLLKRYGATPFRIRFAGPPGTYPTVRYSLVLQDVLDPRIDAAVDADLPEGVGPYPDVESYAEFFRDKIVLIGTSAALLHDVYHTPLARGERFMAGVEIHANAIDTMRRGDALTVPEPWLALLLGIAATVCALLALPPFGPIAGALAAVAAMALYAIGNLAASNAGFELPVFPVVLGIAATWLIGFYGQFRSSERERRRIRATFSRYVSPKVVDEMLRHPDHLPTLRNERRIVTVLFTDIEGFTTFAETHPPDLVAERLNDILSALTQTVFDHGGTLDKYIGDAVMAVWGNIGESHPRGDAVRAAQAAIAMQQAMTALRNALTESDTSPPLRVRIGIHTGEALVGNFGSPLKLDFTAIGDTVNTASRLEGLNKEFGTSIIVSGATASYLTGVVDLRPLGESLLKGKSTGVLVFEVPVPASEPEIASRKGALS